MNLLRCSLTSLCLWVAWLAPAADARTEFLKLLERPRVRLAPQVAALPASNGLALVRFSFATEKDRRVPGVLMKLEGAHGRRPVVIALHGTGGSKQNMLALCRKLATNGFVAVAIDARYHGERITTGKGTEEYNAAIARAFREAGEHPLYFDTVWDVMRLVDYLQTRRDVDAKRIGLLGISKGGIETYLTAAADRRIAVAVPLIGVQSFQWGLANNQWQGRIKTIQSAFDEVTKAEGVAEGTPEFVRRFYDRVVPGIYGEFDGPGMLPLIAPRPLLVINGDTDPNTPLPGVLQATAAAGDTYQRLGVENRFEFRLQVKTGHQVRPESERASIEWLEKWLRP